MTRHALTDARKKTFLKVLAETGSPTAAASAATPWSKHRQGGLASFRDEARRDVEFAAAWERAQQKALAAVEQEIVRRAMQPPRRAVWHKGELVGWTEDRNSSDKLLLRLAARLDPQWRERTTVDQNVQVQATVFAITPQDVLLLAEDERDLLVNLLDKIANIRGEQEEDNEDEAPRLPAPSGDSSTQAGP
jgi:hypothetical protein